MIPKTEAQRQVVLFSSKLPAITEKQQSWAFKHCFDRYAYRAKKEITCFECGHKWAEDGSTLRVIIGGCSCPSCGTELKLRPDKKRKLHYAAYYSTITTSGDFQVVRFYMLWQNCRMGEEARYHCNEVYQQWIDPKGEVIINALNVNGLSSICDQWAYGSNFEVRSNPDHLRYHINPYQIYPVVKCIDIIKRNGFTGKFHDIAPRDLFTYILKYPRAETLLKAGQYSVLKSYTSSMYKIDKYWPSVKICIRNNYLIKDAGMWLDHLDLLEYFKMDIRNSKYICPANLCNEHNILVERKRRQQERERQDRDREKLERYKGDAAKAERQYKKEKRQFLDIQFSDGTIHVRVLKSVNEFLEEGNEMHHCLFTNAYYKRKDSLILSARKDEERLETVEVSLSKMDIVQCRGPRNQNTQYHESIVNLVKDNINVIKSRYHIAKRGKTVKPINN